MLRRQFICIVLLALAGDFGCASTSALNQNPPQQPVKEEVATPDAERESKGPVSRSKTPAPRQSAFDSPQSPQSSKPADPIVQVQFEELSPTAPDLAIPYQGTPGSGPAPIGAGGTPAGVAQGVSDSGELPLEAVISSVYSSFPLLEAAIRGRDVADGERVAAAGEFDLKLKGASENQPAGFYQTYRQNVGFVQPLYSGGEVFTGYRLGRGTFEPWFLNRQTNGGGEFKAGAAIPLSRNRQIDERRARLWNSTWDRKLVEPEIQSQLIDFVRDASYSYWDWVAAGRRYRIAESLLNYALERDAAIQRKVELGDTEEPVLKDNRRLIVSREAKLIDVRRKLQQSAIKLSLYYRTAAGESVIAAPEQLPDFPDEPPVDAQQVDRDILAALDQRPELRIIDLTRRQLEVDYAQAHNEFRPNVDGFVAGSKDVGAETSFLGYKTPLEVEAGVLVDVPLQRRKARGKMSAVDAKLMQLAAKRRITGDKITIEVQAAYTAMVAALERVVRARESVELAAQLAAIERRKAELGEVDLLSVNIRELQAAEAADVEVDALLDYFLARTDYRAALAIDRLPDSE